MELKIDHDDVENFFVDRTGVASSETGRQGLYFHINGLDFVFADEEDAVRVARRVLQRMGEVWEPPPMLGVPRSPGWARVRAEHLETQPECQFCGAKRGLEVHHVLPFHLHPALELDPTNLITLCGHLGLHNCHLLTGHLGSYDRYNPDVREDCRQMQEKIAHSRIVNY